MEHSPFKVTCIAPDSYCIDEAGLDLCYLIIGQARALLIDTGTGVGDLSALVASLTDKPVTVAATHGHGDHMGGAVQFEQVYLHPDDWEMARSISPESRRDYCHSMVSAHPEIGKRLGHSPLAPSRFEPELLPLREGHVFDLGGRTLSVREAPGHTPGSVIFVDSLTGNVYSGDAYNALFLLMLPGDRMDAARRFYAHADALLAQRGQIQDFCGGHECPVNPQILPALVACTEGILDGSLQPEHLQIHIFDGDFYRFGPALIALDRPRHLDRL